MTATAAYESVPCNLCGADDPIVVLPALSTPRQGPAYAASGDSPLRDRLVRCRRCDLVYVSPRLKQETIEGGYADVDNSVYLAQASGRLQTFRRAVDWLEKIGVPKGKLLDVGCAGGFFVKAAKEAGWDATGLELSKHLAEFGRKELGVNIVQGTLDRASFSDQSFDVITYWDVLEHVADPSEHLRRARRLLKPNGTLVINYPHYASIWAKLLGRRWWFLIDVHIYYFTPKTLSALLTQCGFTPGEERMHFQTLPLGYLFQRGDSLIPGLGRGLQKVLQWLHLENLPFTYYASQKTMIGRPTHAIKT